MPIATTVEDEVTYLSGVNSSGVVSGNSFGAWAAGVTATGQLAQVGKWSADTAGTTGGTVSYYFNPASNWTASEKQAFVSVLALWSAEVNINFVQTSNASAGITFTRSSDKAAETSIDYTLSGTEAQIGSSHLAKITDATITIDTSQAGFGPIGSGLSVDGGYPWLTILHEVGHALGLGHAGPYDEAAGATNYDSAQNGVLDERAWSVMSYIDPDDDQASYYSGSISGTGNGLTFSYTNTATDFGTTGGYADVPVTPMDLDILAAQRLYGAPVNSPLSGGQVFGFNSNIAGALAGFFDFTQNTKPIVTLFDTGTGNTLNLSGFSGVTNVSLFAGGFSSCDGLSNNLCIGPGTRIDTYYGTAGNNTVLANDDGDQIHTGAGDDTLTGGAGNDVFTAGTGTDVIDGKGGSDTAVYSGNSSLYVITVNSPTSVTITGTGVHDTLTNMEYAQFADKIVNIGSSIEGGPGDDVLLSTAGSDYIDGGAGNDTVSYINATSGVTANLSISGFQNTGGAGSDQFVRIENLTGSPYDDTLTGDGGNNTLSGGGGNDILRGLGGSNILDGGAGTDTAAYALSPGNYYVTANGGGGYTVRGPDPSSPGAVIIDTLTNIEQASFDGTGQTLTMAQFVAQGFNPLEYLASNSDLLVGFGDNQTLAVQHYMQHGYFESRKTTSFNALEYVASNPDLIGSVSDNQSAALENYILTGYGQGRPTTSFNALEYIASNPDLLVGFGDNQTSALEHYILHGYWEGRPTTSFNALEYIASNPDLLVGLHDNQTAALEHYILHGYAEGRPTTSFNALEYIASNTDLLVGLHDNQTAALEHYILHGHAEGRPTTSFNALEYIASNPDLIATLGDNQNAALEQYILTGYGQGRPTASFDVLEYVASNPDLAKAWGSANANLGYEHYILHGHAEGRPTNSFDAVAYLLSNTDLQNGSLTAQGAELHYLNHGVDEGRSPSGAFGTEQTQHVLTLGTQLSDTIATSGDEDWFSVSLTAGQAYTLTLSGADSASGTLADPKLELHSATGVLIASDNDSGPGKDALIHITATSTGTFYLVAAANTATTGTYKILAATG